MPSNWSKGLTKDNHLSIKKISETMKLRKIDNFAIWRQKQRVKGKIKTYYPEFVKNGDLAELIGVTLGDGTITQYARTQEIRIISNSNNPGFIKRYSNIVEKTFKKKPNVIKHNNINAVRISLYEKYISERLGIKTGKRRHAVIVVPDWILAKKAYIVRYLRGLYEAEGCKAEHLPTYTHKFIFVNRNPSMLDNVFNLMERLGFHPHRTEDRIQISKKEEVPKAVKLLRFREYK